MSQARTASTILPARMFGRSRRQTATTVGQAIAIDEMTEAPAAAAVAPPATLNDADGVCQSGLNGLTAGGTEGLDTVSLAADSGSLATTSLPFSQSCAFCQLTVLGSLLSIVCTCRVASMWQLSSQSCTLYKSQKISLA